MSFTEKHHIHHFYKWKTLFYDSYELYDLHKLNRMYSTCPVCIYMQ